VLITSPTILATLSPQRLTGVLTVVLGGEHSTADLVSRWKPGRRLINAYGPTENTIGSTFYEWDGDSDRVLIGAPIANTEVFVMDPRGRLAPLGVPGELWIGGPGVARGYWNRPDLTAERFITHPINQDGRVYRTGDLVRWLPNGQLEFLGRIDRQIKLRGLRIELGEIESALAGHPMVASCTVTVLDAIGDKRLIGYWTPAGDVTAAQLRDWCRESLPDYMVPHHFVRLDHLPLTPNGKIDRAALPPPTGDDLDTGVPYRAPSTDVEAVIAEIWGEVLNLDRIGVDDDFFALGGHSLLATRVVNRLELLTELDVSLQHFFRIPTVAGLSKHVIELFAQAEQAESLNIMGRTSS
jgi:hypothetical protein